MLDPNASKILRRGGRTVLLAGAFLIAALLIAQLLRIAPGEGSAEATSVIGAAKISWPHNGSAQNPGDLPGR